MRPRPRCRKYVDAVRAEGLKVGLYFSLLDWFHDDFPHYGDRNHPMRNNPAYKNDDRDFDRYLTYMHNQVREIAINYGKLDVLWFDFPTIRAARRSAMESDGADQYGAEAPAGCHHRQPSRGERRGLRFSGGRKSDPVPTGDFVSPEQMIPPNGIQDVNGNDIA